MAAALSSVDSFGRKAPHPARTSGVEQAVQGLGTSSAPTREPLASNPSSTCSIVHTMVSPSTSEPKGTKQECRHAGVLGVQNGAPYDNRDTKIALPQLDACRVRSFGPPAAASES
jgi:hypothetical protein